MGSRQRSCETLRSRVVVYRSDPYSGRRSHKRCVARQGPRGTHPSRAGGCAHNHSRPWTLPSVLVAWLPGPLKGSCGITNHDPATGPDERPRVPPDGCAGRGRNPPFACARPGGTVLCSRHGNASMAERFGVISVHTGRSVRMQRSSPLRVTRPPRRFTNTPPVHTIFCSRRRLL
jgi:hypothetical protein